MRHLSQKGGINLEKVSPFVISVKHLLKWTHPLSPLLSRQGDVQTACHIDKEKGYRIPFENVLIKPIPPRSVMSCPGELKNHHEESTQTPKSSCHWFPKSSKGTSVKVCTFPIIMYTYTHCMSMKRHLFYYTDSVLENKICHCCDGISLSFKFIANYLV